VVATSQTQYNLFGEDLSLRYEYDMMRYVLNSSVVCGNAKNCYQLSCFTRRDGKTGIRSFDVDIALQYDYLYYSTTFKRNGVNRSEIIKTFIIDVDYRPVEDLDLMHKIISDKVLAPTFTTKTSKGYQFLYALKSPFILSTKGEKYARGLNSALIDKFLAAGIEIDMGASSRLTSTYRNPLVHEHKFNNITYSVEKLKTELEIKEGGARKGFSRSSDKILNKNESSAKYEAQKKILDDGFIDGNRNNYFYLLANKECVLNDIQNYNDALMVCNMVADDLHLQNNNIDEIANSEIKATANQLYRYIKNECLYMPTVFCSSKKDINVGRYRAELNATVGYTDLTTRRSMAMKFVQRDRKAKTIDSIQKAIDSLTDDDYISFYHIYKKVGLITGLSSSTVRRYLQDSSNTLTLTKRIKIAKNNVLDFMALAKIGVYDGFDDKILKRGNKSDITSLAISNNSDYNITIGAKSIIYNAELCISEAFDDEIEHYERMGWEIMPF